MKITFKIVEIINICALTFLLAGAYGIAFTGALQVLAAILFVLTFPKNKLIYIYFGLVILFFLIWNGEFSWLFLLPISLIFFLTFIIYNQKKKL
ncbi:hypothetical protein [Flavobacterium sp. LHD-85]|uniref:hypothetical protein n=1 Tax=Flavobacterium sp. LHD-85 TaxID=3071410 RepID=UPI0027DEECA8|nr:hypothetical protein [Flavobacterium sp. LHD-85]MDQ6529499.1 hypothetical protein [Flavobacterium sp. LHD-85]